jgi:hypothetical protein
MQLDEQERFPPENLGRPKPPYSGDNSVPMGDINRMKQKRRTPEREHAAFFS